jgi:outer membrane immunogenic protein
MKRLFLSTAALALLSGGALAADLPAYEPPPVAVASPVVYDWTGFYVGLFAGYGWGDVDVTDVDGYNGGGGAGDFSYDTNGFYAGAYGGFNMQWNWVVAGIEGEAAWLDLDDSAQFPPYVGVRLADDSRASIDTGFYGTITGRLGVALDRVLIYGKGGVALADVDVSYIDTDPAGTTLVAGTTADDWLTGWTLGGGIEAAVGQHFVLRGEYMFTDLGDISHVATASSGATFEFQHEVDNLQTVKVGAAYKF